MTDLFDNFAREYPIWHMVVRGTAVYWFLLLVFRFVLRRDIDRSWLRTWRSQQRRSWCEMAG